MNLYSINLDTFNDLFEKEYERLYDNHDNIAGFEEAWQTFDISIKRDKSMVDFLNRFNKFRQDLISSDREAAAFMFALADITEIAI